jgi:hypothetical protein
MWSYYGSKSKIVDFFPAPKHAKVIEPFAGSARYALKHFDREVLLVDKYEVVVRIWKWLQTCSPNDLLKLPKLEQGALLTSFDLSDDERLFLGMIAGVASTSPRNKVSMYAAAQNGNANKVKRIAAQLYKIKHWTVQHGSYEDIPNQAATWFIDPPYQFGGNAYVENKINFGSLAPWCQTRTGQVIVCENTKATWLDFKPMTVIQGAAQTFTTEAIWTNEPTLYDNEQTKLFAA